MKLAVTCTAGIFLGKYENICVNFGFIELLKINVQINLFVSVLVSENPYSNNEQPESINIKPFYKMFIKQYVCHKLWGRKLPTHLYHYVNETLK